MIPQEYVEWEHPDPNIIMLGKCSKKIQNYSGIRSQNSVTFGRREEILLKEDMRVWEC